MQTLDAKTTAAPQPLKQRLLELSKTIPKGKWIMAETIAREWGCSHDAVVRAIKAIGLRFDGRSPETTFRVIGLRSWGDR